MSLAVAGFLLKLAGISSYSAFRQCFGSWYRETSPRLTDSHTENLSLTVHLLNVCLSENMLTFG